MYRRGSIAAILLAISAAILMPFHSFAATSTVAPSTDQTAQSSGLAAAINSTRASYGLPALSDDGSLDGVAQYRSQDQVSRHYFSHVAPDGTTIFSLLDAEGINWMAAGENLAESRGVDPVNAAIDGFMQSPEHRANVLNPSYTSIGVGSAQTSDGTIVLTVVFTG